MVLLGSRLCPTGGWFVLMALGGVMLGWRMLLRFRAGRDYGRPPDVLDT